MKLMTKLETRVVLQPPTRPRIRWDITPWLAVLHEEDQFFIPLLVPNPGDYIYHHTRRDMSGFGGATLKFRLLTGEILEVKGPWHTNTKHLLSATSINLEDYHYTWGFICNECNYNDPPNGISGIHYYDPEASFVLGSFDRLKNKAQEIADELGITVTCYSLSMGGSSLGPVKPLKSKSK